MGAAFVLVAGLCVLYKSRLALSQSPLFGTVRREWEEDRVVLERILGSEPE
jgi:hypothetical protein